MKLIFAGILAGLLATTAAKAEDMVFTSWGGTTQEAQNKSWADPFTAASGIKVLQDGPTDYGKLKAMVDAAASTGTSSTSRWISPSRRPRTACSSRSTSTACRRPTSTRASPPTMPSAASTIPSCSAGTRALSPARPAGWADLFDTEEIPGKRTFYKWSAPGVLEIALLADGVPADKLYPLDLDRAFKKLDTIKNDIVWWGGGAESQQLLASGEARVRPVLERPRLRAGEGRRRCRRVLEPEPDGRRRAGRAEGRQEQGRGDEVPGRGNAARPARRSSPKPAAMRRSTPRQRPRCPPMWSRRCPTPMSRVRSIST